LIKKNQKIKAAPHFPKNNAPRRKENELGVTGNSSTIKCDYWPLRLMAGCLRQRFLCFWLRMHYFLREIAPRPELNTQPGLLSDDYEYLGND